MDKKAHPADMEAHFGDNEVHLWVIKDHSRSQRVSPWSHGSSPRRQLAHTGDLKSHLEPCRLTLYKWRLTNHHAAMKDNHGDVEVHL